MERTINRFYAQAVKANTDAIAMYRELGERRGWVVLANILFFTYECEFARFLDAPNAANFTRLNEAKAEIHAACIALSEVRPGHVPPQAKPLPFPDRRRVR